MSIAAKSIAPSGYQALSEQSVAAFLVRVPSVAKILGGHMAQWQVREVGDGNLNLVFIVQGVTGAVAAKQALPYVRLVGESWPLPLARAYYERLALAEQARWAPEYVPALLHYDDTMALTVMEYLSPHIIVRQGLMAGTIYPQMAQHLGVFLARTLYHTSDLHLDAAAKKRRMADFLGNTAMCKISEDLIFDEPYYNAPMNRHTAPQLDAIAAAFRHDDALRAAAQAMKWRFMNAPEALIHGDLHTGSIMATATDTRVIDPEFAFYGPMGFDVGALLGNLWMAYFAQAGQEETPQARAAYAEWLLAQAETVWQVFADCFAALWRLRDSENSGGDAYRIAVVDAALREQVIAQRLAAIWQDTLGFAACKIIRRILGLAHVADFDSIVDPDRRAACETRALQFARALLLRRAEIADSRAVTTMARHEN